MQKIFTTIQQLKTTTHVSFDHLSEMQHFCTREECTRALEKNLSIHESHILQEKAEEYLFGERGYAGSNKALYQLLQDKQYKQIATIRNNRFSAIIEQKKEIIDTLLENAIGCILVRQEVLHSIEKIAAYLENHGFSILNIIKKKITREQYWGLYVHTFNDEEKEHHARRRAFGYQNRECIALIITPSHTTPIHTSAELMDLIKERHKGHAGEKKLGTLRGEVVFDAVEKILFKNEKINFALDPLMSYEHYELSTQGNLNNIMFHFPGVHIPEKHEIEKDLAVLFTHEELETFYYSKKKYDLKSSKYEK